MFSSSKPTSVTHARVLWVTALLLASFLLSNALSEISSSSEAREVLVSRTLAEGGEWIVPRRNGIIASKPPLHHWITASVAILFDLPATNWLHRSIASLFAFFTLLLVSLSPIFLIRSSRGGDREQRKGETGCFRTGLLGAFILCSIPSFFRLASDARVDMVFCFFSSLAVFSAFIALLRHDSYEQAKRERLFIPFASMGAACLAKGPLGIVLPMIVIFSGLIPRFGLVSSLWLLARPRLAWIPLFLLGPTWYVLGAMDGGSGFIERHLYENLERMKGGAEIKRAPIWFYLKSWCTRSFPWFLVFLFVLFKDGFFSKKRASTVFGHSERELHFERALFYGILGGTVFLSACSGKRHSYLLPLYPPFAVYLAYRIVDLFERSSNTALFRLEGTLLFLKRVVLCAVVVLIFLFVAGSLGVPHQSASVYYIETYIHEKRFAILASLLFIGFLYWLIGKKPQLQDGFRVGVALVAVIVVVNGVGQGLKAKFKNYYSFARAINEVVPPTASLVIHKKLGDERFDVLLSYLGRPVSIRSPNALTDEHFDYELSIDSVDNLPVPEQKYLLSHQTLGEKRRGSKERMFLRKKKAVVS